MKPPIKNCKWVMYPLGDITQMFGSNPKLYMEAMGLKAHNGIDIVRPNGEHMYAVEDGIVCAVKLDEGGHGRHFRLVSNEKTKEGYRRDWVYGHMKYIAVKNGQEVKAGQFVGTMGNTGFVVSGNTPYWSTNPYAGTHLHLGVRHLKEVKRGWKYEGCELQFESVNYDNGYKGRFDPLPLFLDPALKSTKVFTLASTKQDKTLFQFAELLKRVGL